ncbi:MULTISPECIES: hypothetical protein [Prosthecochloris]|uniref:CARDB domain-containing protein n=1 Tax=Prosthecochloris marina TaxID=2017681 RepID=A0A317TAH5_9CHLB|nr:MULTISPECIES: hypothetical protein [Prosthecochloris]PWW82626.1 hypothetical protein CR164_02415 [Prosthecochloris marina]UZJ38095.1 hypothetical protein OO005_02505 [Prosthecochloris sp. SCSIO W1103]
MILFVESPGSKKRRIGAILAVLVLFASLLFLMNDYRLSESTTGDIQREQSWARSGVMPDIIVSGIEVQPVVPRVNEPFVLSVFCQNIGIVRSGLYSIDVIIRDANGMEVFKERAIRKNALEPGQIGVAFSASVTLDGDPPGLYTISIVASPEGFEDSNLENNRGSRVVDMT